MSMGCGLIFVPRCMQARDELNGLRSEQGPEDVGDDMDELVDLLDQAICLAYQISPPAGRV